jgi:tetratricopeptide (TPR) repeat protein
MKLFSRRLTAAAAVIMIAAVMNSCSDMAIRYYNEGITAANDGNLKKAVSLWEKSLEIRETDPDTHFNLGAAYLEMQKYRKAEESFRKAIEYRKGDPVAHYKLGRSLQAQNRIVEAKKSYKMAIQLKQNYVPPYIGVAECALIQDNPNTAEKYSSIALRLSPGSIRANTLLGEALFEQGNYADAYMQIAPLRDTVDKNLLFVLGKVMYHRRMYSDALKTLTDANSLGLSSAGIYLYLGLTSMKLRRYEQAREYARKAVYLDDSLCEGWSLLGNLMMEENKWKEALEALEKGYDCNPGSADIRGKIGIVLLNLDRTEEAAAELSAAVEKMQDPGLYLYYLGVSYFELSEMDKAVEPLTDFIDSWKGSDDYLVRARDLRSRIMEER